MYLLYLKIQFPTVGNLASFHEVSARVAWQENSQLKEIYHRFKQDVYDGEFKLFRNPAPVYITFYPAIPCILLAGLTSFRAVVLIELADYKHHV